MGHKNGIECVVMVERGWGFTELSFASFAMWKCKETDPKSSFARNAGSVSAATSAITMQRLGSSRSAGSTVSQLFPVQIHPPGARLLMFARMQTSYCNISIGEGGQLLERSPFSLLSLFECLSCSRAFR